MRWPRQVVAATAAAVWLAAIGVGVAVAVREQITAGSTGTAPATWPAASRLAPLTPGKSRVVMFVHPQCPCSRASLTELAAIVAAVGDRAEITIVFDRPAGAGDDWLDTDRWTQAQRIPGAAVIVDDGGERTRFGALTSGHTVVYDPRGALVFAGGITAARAHAGDNVGREQVIGRILGAGGAVTHPVYGCGFGAPR